MARSRPPKSLSVTQRRGPIKRVRSILSSERRPLRAAIYARVSTQEQVDGTSLESQRVECTAYCDRSGWTVVDEYVDAGVSGAKESRPGLDRLMDAARAGEIDVVVVSKLDRFGRSLRHLVNGLADLEDLGVQFVSVAEAIDSTTAVGKLYRHILAAFAEFERSRITERMLAGHLGAARLGKWPGGPAPWGYRLVQHPDGYGKTLEPDPEEAKIIRTAVSLVLDDGLSPYGAAKRLNALGYRTRTGSPWRHPNLRRRLRDPSLIGRMSYGQRSDTIETIEMRFPPLIDEERWEALQRRLDATARGPKQAKRQYPLTGRLLNVCGEAMTGVWREDRKTRYYRCKTRIDERGWRGDPCGCRSLRADDVEYVVWEQVTRLLAQPDLLMKVAAEWFEARSESAQSEAEQIASIEQRISDLEEAKGSKAAELLRLGVDSQTVAAAIREIDNDITELRRHRAQLKAWSERNATAGQRMVDLTKLAGIAVERLANMTPHQQRQIIEALDLTVRVVQPASRKRPAQIRIEGAVSERLVDHLGNPQDAELKRSS